MQLFKKKVTFNWLFVNDSTTLLLDEKMINSLRVFIIIAKTLNRLKKSNSLIFAKQYFSLAANGLPFELLDCIKSESVKGNDFETVLKNAGFCHCYSIDQ